MDHTKHFNPRSREGSDRTVSPSTTTTRYFNPRSREGSDPRSSARSRHCCHFNPRSREGSDLGMHIPFQRRQHFNPRSREGSDLADARTGWPVEISIHAPVKGATCDQTADPDSFNISIHAPVKGATPAGRGSPPHPPNFNPRSREGSDNPRGRVQDGRPNFNPRSREGSDMWFGSPATSNTISIHAPVKGATHSGAISTSGQLFQSTLP